MSRLWRLVNVALSSGTSNVELNISGTPMPTKNIGTCSSSPFSETLTCIFMQPVQWTTLKNKINLKLTQKSWALTITYISVYLLSQKAHGTIQAGPSLQVSETLVCDHSNESYWALLLWSTFFMSTFYEKKFAYWCTAPRFNFTLL